MNGCSRWKKPFRGCPAGRMTHGKSQLNPHAAPYIPAWKLLSGTRDEAWTICNHKNMVIDKSMGHNLPEFLDYGILNIEHLSSEESSQAGQHVIPNDIHRDELSELDSFIEKLDSLSSLFPDISVEYLSELLDVHHDDLQETIVVMQQFECDGSGTPGFADANIYDLASLKATSIIHLAESSSNADVVSQKANCHVEIAVSASQKANCHVEIADNASQKASS